MPGEAKQYIDISITNVETALGTLKQALDSAEKSDNRNKIQAAINSLNSATQQLSQYKD